MRALALLRAWCLVGVLVFSARFLTARTAIGEDWCSTSDASVNDPSTVAWANRLVGALGEDSACQLSRADDDQAAFTANTPCNVFAGRVLERLYGVKDFYVTPPDENKPFYRANEIATLLQAGVWQNWTQLGSANDQDVLDRAKTAADAGKLVIAVWRDPNPNAPGHIALIGPGPLRHSGAWNKNTPPAASLTLGNPSKGFLGKPLSCAFTSDKAPEVKIWVRGDD
jgi:hypothetical protein